MTSLPFILLLRNFHGFSLFGNKISNVNISCGVFIGYKFVLRHPPIFVSFNSKGVTVISVFTFSNILWISLDLSKSSLYAERSIDMIVLSKPSVVMNTASLPAFLAVVSKARTLSFIYDPYPHQYKRPAPGWLNASVNASIKDLSLPLYPMTIRFLSTKYSFSLRLNVSCWESNSSAVFFSAEYL